MGVQTRIFMQILKMLFLSGYIHPIQVDLKNLFFLFLAIFLNLFIPILTYVFQGKKNPNLEGLFIYIFGTKNIFKNA